jgi:hypothetical protein
MTAGLRNVHFYAAKAIGIFLGLFHQRKRFVQCDFNQGFTRVNASRVSSNDAVFKYAKGRNSDARA